MARPALTFWHPRRAVHQHGPAATYGAPYVYSYKADDEADMVAKIKLAKENPIGRL